MDFKGAIICNRGIREEPEGYSLVKLRSVTLLGLLTIRTEFRITIKPVDPLCIKLVDGTSLVPNYTFVTDFGSTFPLNFIFDPLRYLAYIMHDSACRFGGMYDTNGVFHKMSRKEADLMLYHLLEFEGAWLTTKSLVFIGVRIGAVAGIGAPKGDLAKFPVEMSRFYRTEEYDG